MYRSRKIITWILVVIGVVAALLFIAVSVYINRFKPHMEDLLTSNIGIPTRIDGAISLKVMPGLSFAAHKVKVVSNETYVLSIEKVEISVDYTRIFSKTIHVKELHFKRPQLYIVRYLDGSYNFDVPTAAFVPPGNGSAANHEIDLAALTVRNASILYIDMAYEDTLKADGIYLESEDIGLEGTLESFEPEKIRFRGSLAIDQFKLNQLMIDSMRFEVIGNKGLLEINEKSTPFLGGEVTGKLLFDFTKEPVLIRNQHQVAGLDMGEFFRSAGMKTYLSGKADYQLEMTFRSFSWSEAMATMNGSFNLQGRDLQIHGLNLHRMIGRLGEGLSFNAVDMMGIFLAGPYGAVFSKGMDFTQLKHGNPEVQTPVKYLVSNWQITDGVARSKDVAFQTGVYRIALNGAIDFTTDQYRGLEIGLLNREGCAAYRQTLNGSFAEPATSGMLDLGILQGPVGSLPVMLSRSSRGNCTPFYTGSVKHP